MVQLQLEYTRILYRNISTNQSITYEIILICRSERDVQTVHLNCELKVVITTNLPTGLKVSLHITDLGQV
jgi:hypothetical protein